MYSNQYMYIHVHVGWKEHPIGGNTSDSWMQQAQFELRQRSNLIFVTFIYLKDILMYNWFTAGCHFLVHPDGYYGHLKVVVHITIGCFCIQLLDVHFWTFPVCAASFKASRAIFFSWLPVNCGKDINISCEV